MSQDHNMLPKLKLLKKSPFKITTPFHSQTIKKPVLSRPLTLSKWKLSEISPTRQLYKLKELYSWRPEQLTCRVFPSVTNELPFQDHFMSNTIILT